MYSQNLSNIRFMNRVAILALGVSFLLISSPGAQAQLLQSTSKVGTTAAQFLKIGAGARSLGLGGAFAAIGGDINSIYWNPAGVARIPGSGEVTFNHANWLADINYDFAAVAINLGDFGTIGGSFISFRVPEDIVRTLENPEGDGRSFDAASIAIAVSYARNLTDRFSIGFTGKFIGERIWNERSQGFALDIGTLYRTPFNDLTIGASISNFGSKLQMEGRDVLFNRDINQTNEGGPRNVPAEFVLGKYEIPLTFRIGLAMDLWNQSDIRVTAAADATHPNDNTEYVNGGLEVSYSEVLFGRIGYKSTFLRDSEQGLTWGVGLHYKIINDVDIKIDYAFADYGRLKNVQFLSVGLQY